MRERDVGECDEAMLGRGVGSKCMGEGVRRPEADGARDLRTKAEARVRTWWKTRKAVIVLERERAAVGDESGETSSSLGEEREGAWTSESGWKQSEEFERESE